MCLITYILYIDQFIVRYNIATRYMLQYLRIIMYPNLTTLHSTKRTRQLCYNEEETCCDGSLWDQQKLS